MKIRKGFTLVELLIVVVIIGILAGTMLLTMSGSGDAARAAKIISDMRTLKSALLLLSVDSPDIARRANVINAIDIGNSSSGWNYVAMGEQKAQKEQLIEEVMLAITKYIDDPSKVKAGTQQFGAIYDVVHSATFGTQWWIQYHMEDVSQGVGDKLKAQAASVGLYLGPDKNKPYDGSVGYGFYVSMIAR